MTVAPFALCKIYVDGIRSLRCGHYIITVGPRAKAAYHVVSMRQNRNRPERRHLECERVKRDEIPRGAVVHEMKWYARGKRKRR